MTISAKSAPFRTYLVWPLEPEGKEAEVQETYRGRSASGLTREVAMMPHASGSTVAGHVKVNCPPHSVNVGDHALKIWDVRGIQDSRIFNPNIQPPPLGINKCLPYWKNELQFHPDEQFSAHVLQLIEFGVPIGNHKPILPGIYENWPSTEKFREGVQKYINKHIAAGAIEGPLPTLPSDFRGSPLGAFEKGAAKKLRIIHDLSWPPGGSVNDNIDKEDFTVQYTSVHEAVRMCCKMSTPWLAKTDLCDAYLQCPVLEKDRNVLGFTWTNELGVTGAYRCCSLVLGLRSSPSHFSSIAKALCFICINNGAPPTTIQYLDDFLTCANSYEQCSDGLKVVTTCAKAAGFEIKDTKTVGPARVLEFLGIIIDTISRELRISQERLTEIRTELEQWNDKKKCKKRELLSLLGKLNFLSQVIVPGHMFCRRLIDLSKKGKTLYSTLYLDKECRADICWWLRNMRENNGVAWFPKECDATTAEIIFSDAADGAAAAVWRNSWTVQHFSEECSWIKSKHICFKELYAVVLGIGTFKVALQGKQVIMKIDNMTVFTVLSLAKALIRR